MGLWTYTKGNRNFNIIRKDAGGNFASLSLVSTYKLTATEYSETLLFSIRNDQIGGKGTVYDLSGNTQRTPVKTEGGAYSVQNAFRTTNGYLPGKQDHSHR